MFKELLSTPTTQLGKASRFVVFQIKLWSHCARLLKINRAGQQAAALAYHTVFGIVPLAIVILMMLQTLSPDIGRNVKQLLYEHMNLTEIKFGIQGDQGQAEPNSTGATDNQNIIDPNQVDATQDPNLTNSEDVQAQSVQRRPASDKGKNVQSDEPKYEEKMLTEYLDDIVNTFFAGLNKGSITIASLLIIVWAALGLLSTIERAFNQIWHVTRGRGFLHRIINYWAILTLGPLLIGLGVFVSTRYTQVGELQRTIVGVPRFGPILVSYFVATVAFFLLYFVLPNTKVKAKAAIWGAVVAALVWTLAKWGFSQYVTGFIPYNRIYGLVGLVPLAVLWIYITWLIVLFGLQLTFTTQHLTTLDAAEIAAARKNEEYFVANDLTAINVVKQIAMAFQQNSSPLELEVLCSRLNIPGEFGEKILMQLVDKGLVVRTSEPRTGFVPGREPANIRLSEIVEAVEASSLAQPDSAQSPALSQIGQSQKDALAQYSLSDILETDVGFEMPQPNQPPTAEQQPPTPEEPHTQTD